MSALKVTDLNGVKVYNVTNNASLPKWLSEKQRRALRKDAEHSRRVELVQDLEMPTSTRKLLQSPDGEYLIATGVYPPQMRCYELSQLSMKFERHMDSEAVDALVLSSDYSKLCFLCADRSVNFHAKFGFYHKTRIPRAGRSMAYCAATCDMLLTASAPEIYRLNLDQGRFLQSLPSASPGVNCSKISPFHGLFVAGGEDGALECFDLRARRAVGRTRVGEAEVTALAFDELDHLQVAAGTSDGQIKLYDLRSSKPLLVKDHMYGYPILDLTFHSQMTGGEHRRVISADRQVVKVWDRTSGDTFTAVEPAEDVGGISQMCMSPHSGLIMLAVNSPRVQGYFIPSLGPAPRWCAFLENLTEELEEDKQPAVYDDFKFITKEELNRLSLTHLVGTNLLRGYMHGFFVDYRLYLKAKRLAEPFAYEEYRAERMKQKLHEKSGDRIAPRKKVPKVNKELAARLVSEAGLATNDDEADEDSDGELPGGKRKRSKKSTKEAAQELLQDDRFKPLFSDPRFQVDVEDPEYKALHPNQSTDRSTSLLDEHYEEVDEDDEEGEGMADGDGDVEGDDGELEEDLSLRGPHYDSERTSKPGKPDARKSTPRREVKMYSAKDASHAKAYAHNESTAQAMEMPLSSRVRQGPTDGVKVRWMGASRELQFKAKGGRRTSSPASGAKHREGRRSADGLGSRGKRPR